MKSPQVSLVKASLDDLGFILSCSQQTSLQNRRPQSLAEMGFLVSDFTEQEYRVFIGRADHFYIANVARVGPAGFVLAYSDCLIDKDKEWTNALLSYYLYRPFVLIKQICVSDDFSSMGVGASLYGHVAKCNAGIPLVAAVVSVPPNERSMHFHSKQGFRNIMEVNPPADVGRCVSIWWKGNGYDGDCSRVITMN